MQPIRTWDTDPLIPLFRPFLQVYHVTDNTFTADFQLTKLATTAGIDLMISKESG
jgi:hypothetical protein